jgi:hypothetical protein
MSSELLAAEALVELAEQLNAAAILAGFRTDPVNPRELDELNAYFDEDGIPELYKLPECQALFDTMLSMGRFAGGNTGPTLSGGGIRSTHALLNPKLVMTDDVAMETLATLGDLDSVQQAMDAQVLIAAQVATAVTGTVATLMGFQDLIGFWALASQLSTFSTNTLAFLRDCYGAAAFDAFDSASVSLAVAMSLYVYLRRSKVREGVSLVELIAADGARGAVLFKDALLSFGKYVSNTKDAIAYFFTEMYTNWTCLLSAASSTIRELYSSSKAKAAEIGAKRLREELLQALDNAEVHNAVDLGMSLQRELARANRKRQSVSETRDRYGLGSVSKFVYNFFPRVTFEIGNLFSKAYDSIFETTPNTTRFKTLLRRKAEINRDRIQKEKELESETARLRREVSSLTTKNQELMAALQVAFSVYPSRSRSRSRSRGRK